MSATNGIPGFARTISRRDKPAIAIFGAESTGKTALAVSAGEWAREHGTTPGWLVTDRKTPRTVEERCNDLGLELPYMNQEPFITPAEAAALIRLDRWDAKDQQKVMELYTRVCQRFLDAAAVLAANPAIDPVVIDVGTTFYDWACYSYNAKKQDVGMQVKWGPPQLLWKTLCDGLEHKHTLITFWAKDEWKAGSSTGRTIPDGPKTLGYTVTTQVRMNYDRHRGGLGDITDRFSLDVWDSQDSKALAGVNNVLAGSEISYANLLALLRPEEV